MTAINAQCVHHQLSDGAQGTKEDIDYRSGSGTAQAGILFRSGSEAAIGTGYNRMGMSIGVYDTSNQYCATFMNDPELADNSTDSRHAHSAKSVAMRTQSSPGSNYGINEQYDFTDNKVDAIEINSLSSENSDDMHATFVPITSGIEQVSVGTFAVGTGAGTVTISQAWKPDLVLFTSAMRATAPSADDVDTDSFIRAGFDAQFMFGAASRVTNQNRCYALHEERNQPGPVNTNMAEVLRNDACIAKITGTSLDFTGVVDWSEETGFKVTVTSGAAGEYVIYQAFKFTDPSSFALADTLIPDTGDWTHTGLLIRPNTVINLAVKSCVTVNTIAQAGVATAFNIFDTHDGWSHGITQPDDGLYNDSASASFYNNDISIYRQNDSTYAYETELAGPLPTMTDDGFTSATTTHPGDDVHGFAIIFGAPPTRKVSIAGYTTV